ncbi:MAG: hypothetical protein ABW352_25455 [Polyangiales bacterium]
MTHGTHLTCFALCAWLLASCNEEAPSDDREPPPAASIDGSSSGGADARIPNDAGRVTTPDAAARADADAPPLIEGMDASEPTLPPGPAEGSCYGRCGMPELLADRGSCACDPECLTRGDCCADKHELCAVSARTPLCTLTGREIDRAVCGTDLGWTFEHDGEVEVLFGDTYGYDCQDPYPNDDAQATLPLERPSVLPAQPTTPVACGNLLQFDKKPALLGGETFAPILLYENGQALSSFLGETPLTAFSDGEHAYMIARRGNTIEGPVYIGWRDPSAAPGVQPARTVYRSGAKTSLPFFRNPAAATVAHYDPAQPQANDWSAGGHTLFVFGRGDFAGAPARSVHLAQHRLPLVQPDGSMKWTPSYFTGLTADGPQWSDDPAQAKPILENDFQQTMQFDVEWFPQLQKWVMLYGGDVADWVGTDGDEDQPRHGALHMRLADAPWGPWSRAAPAFWREHAGAFMHCDAPADAARPGCDLDELPDDPKHSYSPGTWAPQLLDFPGCISAALTPSQPNFSSGNVQLPCLGAQRGNLYGPSFIASWTADLAGDQGYAHAATLYFLVSTWMPYQVVLASLTVHLP